MCNYEILYYRLVFYFWNIIGFENERVKIGYMIFENKREFNLEFVNPEYMIGDLRLVF